MTIHIFVGVGPANLHRALKIQKIDPSAKLVFIDNRIIEKDRVIDRASARANIFRFETDDVTEKLIEDGISPEELEPLIYKREFSVPQGFQEGDDRVFSNKPFTQIQIRDLQILFMKTIDRKAGPNLPLMLNRKLDLTNEEVMQAEIARILHEQRAQLDINPDEVDLQIHVATGALRGDDDKAEIIYPDKATYNMHGATDDILALTVTPVHGTTTFFIPEPHKEFLDKLKENQRSLDRTGWQPALEQYGWSLVRPPRIRVFYANDVLYIGAEIPANFMAKSKEEFEQKVTEYTRTIASLVFPGLPIADLPVNPVLRSRFPTSRGERGEVISSKGIQYLEWAEGETLRAKVTVSNHGDSRYLPHYQTGSGFVTAFLNNELYEEIYSKKSIRELVTYANAKISKSAAAAHEEPPVPLEVDKIVDQYMSLTNFNEKDALEAFQKELFMTFSRDVIDENKKKVGRYLNAIHTQALNALSANLDMLLNMYNRHHGTQLQEEMFRGHPRLQVIIELLKTDKVNFLKEIMPQLLNADFDFENDLTPEGAQQLRNMRDVHLQDFEHNLDLSKAEARARNANQKGIHNVIVANLSQNIDSKVNSLNGKLDYITSQPEMLMVNITTIAESLKNNKALHHRAAIALFTGVHSATM